MKVVYLNPVIQSFTNVLNSIAQMTPEKGALSKEEGLTTEKEYTVVIPFEGTLEGFFSFGFEKELALSVIHTMTGGMASTEEVDEMGESVLVEIGSMVQGNAVSELNDLGYDTRVDGVHLYKKDNLPIYPPETALRSLIHTDKGDIEMNMSIWEKK